MGFYTRWVSKLHFAVAMGEFWRERDEMSSFIGQQGGQHGLGPGEHKAAPKPQTDCELPPMETIRSPPKAHPPCQTSAHIPFKALPPRTPAPAKQCATFAHAGRGAPGHGAQGRYGTIGAQRL